MFWIIYYILMGIVWGVVCNKVASNKGYEENWFWWGFFFEIFALIVVITKPTVVNDTYVGHLSASTGNSNYANAMSDLAQAKSQRPKKSSVFIGWVCPSCSRKNEKLDSRCPRCGYTDDKITAMYNKERERLKLNGEMTPEEKAIAETWICTKCKKYNNKHIFICSCGMRRSDNDKLLEEKKDKDKEQKEINIPDKEPEKAENITEAQGGEAEKINALLKYKELLDSGVITQADFDAKKKNLLGL